MKTHYGDVQVQAQNHVALVEIQRPPHNFFDVALIHSLADAFEALDEHPDIRASVLAAQGTAFCAGANLPERANDSLGEEDSQEKNNPLYAGAVRLYACKKPIVGAIHGAAIGGGLGLSLVPDFRVICPETRFCANFVKLGFHPGFGLTHTLPQIIGQQRANLMFFSGRRIKGEEAFQWGLGDVLTRQEKVREEALRLAEEMAENAPLALLSIRATMRQGLAERIKAQTEHENHEQVWQRKTEDFKEGVRAVNERRPGNFVGR